MTPHPIRIVLVDTSHPGNIGATARAMKNMGLDELVLVRPQRFPAAEAVALASGADDLLARAQVAHDLTEALHGVGLVLATTSRLRDKNFRVLEVREAAERAVQEAASAPVAILFGAERTGLTNDELKSAHALLRIPTSEVYASLNVAMAVLLVSYEVQRAARGAPALQPATFREAPLADAPALERLYAHLQQVLDEVDFKDRTQSGTHLMNRIRRLVQRAEPDENEVNILRGILTAVQHKRRRAGESP